VGTFLPNLGMLSLCVLELLTMYMTDKRETDGQTKATLIAPFPTSRAIIKLHKLKLIIAASATLLIVLQSRLLKRYVQKLKIPEPIRDARFLLSKPVVIRYTDVINIL